MALLPSGRFLITEKPGRIRILNSDGSPFHTITDNLPPIYVRGQAGLLDVALDQNYARNRRIFFAYSRNIDADNCGLAVDSAVLDEEAGTLSNVNTILQTQPFTNRATSQSGARIAIDPKDGNLFVSVGDRSTGDPIPLQAQQRDTHLGKVVHITPEGKAAPGNPALGLPEVWSMGHRTPQGLAFAPDGRLWETEHGPRQRVAEAQAAIRQYRGTNAQSLIEECADDAQAVVEKLAEGRRQILAADAAWFAMAKTIGDHLLAEGVHPSGNQPHEHELHAVARILRTTGDTITSPLPHGRHQAFVEEEERVAREWRAKHQERARTTEARS